MEELCSLVFEATHNPNKKTYSTLAQWRWKARAKNTGGYVTFIGILHLKPWSEDSVYAQHIAVSTTSCCSHKVTENKGII
ncbi:unnamed protein product [Brassica rapa subsp. trilocularis]|uniref:(rape) hypothetical protein n=1 Tax=Brassica napus TaxID=3708 RepID=A0A817B4Q2_BRANA|nr:unnamed protein product [Brassica napus]